MATPPPPIIRSTKPFSVEIPQGSNSAKARRSDIVANDELNITHKKSNYHDSTSEITSGVHNERSDTLESPSFLIDANHGADQQHHEPNHSFNPHDSSFNANQDDDNVQHVHEEQKDAHHAELPGSDQLASVQGPVVTADAFADRIAHANEEGAGANNVAIESGANAKDNLQALDTENLKDNLQAVGTETLKNNQQSVSEEGTDQNIQSIEQDKDLKNLQAIDAEQLKDNRQAMATDSPERNTQSGFSEDSQDNFATVDNESLIDKTADQANSALHDHQEALERSKSSHNQLDVASDPEQDRRQSLQQDDISDNLADIEQGSLNDNIQPLANDALPDNTQALADKALADNQQTIDDSGKTPNQQSIENDALVSRTDSIDKEHLHDHIEALPDTGIRLKDGPKPEGKIYSSSVSTNGSDTSKNPSANTAAQELAKRHANPSQAAASAARLEHAKKQGEFHGRVEALRKTVSGINHILDELEEKKPPHKP